MPGLAGIVAKRRDPGWEACLARMVAAMKHEASHRTFLFARDEIGLFLGQVSLGGDGQSQGPARSDDGNVVCALDGEVFEDGSRPSGQSDADRVVLAYERSGERGLRQLNGWYNGLLLDGAREEIYLFNDGYGMLPLYFHDSGEALYFASEAKALLAVSPSLREFRAESLADYIALNHVSNHGSYFRGVDRVPGGSLWRFGRSGLEKGRAFSPHDWEGRPMLDRKRFVRELGETFVRIAPRYAGEDGVGLSLTGGVDTRLLLAALKPEPGRLPTYTFSGMYRQSLDARTARRVAGACGQSHRVFRVGRAYLRDFPTWAEKTVHLTDGVADVDLAHLIPLNRMAAAVAPVRLTGKYGSQVLRGFSQMRPARFDLRLLDPDFRREVVLARDRLPRPKSGRLLPFILFEEIPTIWAGFLLVERSQIKVRSPYLDRDLIGLLHQAPASALIGYAGQIEVLRQTAPHLLRLRTDQGLLGPGPSWLDRAVRAAYQTVNQVDYHYNRDTLPHRWARLDARLGPFHPARLSRGLNRYHHYRLWFGRELAGYVRDVLLDPATLERPYWNPAFLTRAVEDHIHGRGNYAAEIKKIMTIELLHRSLPTAA